MYEAFDQKRQELTALKHLRHPESDALLRFKREFRALADISHPNLVRLGEMLSFGDEWYFTMELIDGQNILEHVRHQDSGGQPGGLVGSAKGLPGTAGFRFQFDELTLRDAFAQLADGVCALHGHGMLHRDLKPSNVLVTREGRVVILDFGLLTNLTGERSGEVHFIGTPAYMSPEQTEESNTWSAADWYSVGVMLFEALTGRRPFVGSVYKMLSDRLNSDPPPPGQVTPGIPSDLDDLCRELLRRDPAARPAGDSVASRIRQWPHEPASPTRPSERATIFVGRDEQLNALGDALEHVSNGGTARVFIRGESGIGKTALARRFLADLDADPDAVVLSGRCYQRESVPYKALDTLIDALSSHLKKLPPDAVGGILPDDWPALARLFPILRSADEFVSGRPALIDIPDAKEVRRRGSAALRDLLTRLGRAHTLVLFIDDLQWGDVDSGLLLRELMRPPEPPSLLFLASYRSEDAESSKLVRMLEEYGESGARRWDLEVDVLSTEEARELALHLLGEDDAQAQAKADVLARESGGSPFFVDELARYGPDPDEAAPETIRLESVIQSRFSQLPDEARHLLEVVALAGQPLDLGVANLAAGLDAKDGGAIAVLRAEQWVRQRGTEGGDLLEAYHDRIRETVAAGVPERRVASYHNRLAVAWEASGVADAETLAEHCERAGDPELAARHARRAADQADAALAFDRAARLYQMSYDLWEPEAGEGRILRIKLAHALANAGRGGEAGRAYLAAAEGGEPGETLELTRAAAEQFLISGHIDEGMDVLRTVLATVGLRLAPSPRWAVLELLFLRLQLALRGFRFRPRRPSEVSPDVLEKIDVCWSVSAGLAVVDVIRGAPFQTKNLLLALRAGEPYRVARALMMELGYSSVGGVRGKRRSDRLFESCRSLAEEVDQPYVHGLLALQEGIVASLQGSLRKSFEATRRGETILREQCTGVTWELDTAQLYHLHSLILMGRWKELSRLALTVMDEARQRSDNYMATYLRTRILYMLHLLSDDPVRAQEEQNHSLYRWSKEGFQVQHYWDWYSHGDIDLYCGRPEAAWERLTSHWRTYRRSLLSRAEGVRIEIAFLRARTAITLAAEARPSRSVEPLRRAERDARSLESEKAPWGEAQAVLARAGIASVRGDRTAAKELVALAEERLQALDMLHYARAARWRLGQLTGGSEGQELVREARSWMEDQGARNPERMVTMLAPGRWA